MEIKIEGQRFLQFSRAVRAGTTKCKLLEIDQPEIEYLEIHDPDSRLNCSISDWIKLNGIKAQGIKLQPWCHITSY